MAHTVKIVFRQFPRNANEHKGLELQLTQWRNRSGWQVKGTSIIQTRDGAHIMYTLETGQASPSTRGMESRDHLPEA